MIAQEKFGKLCKERILAELLSRLEANTNFFVTSYMGLTNAELEHLRRNLKKASSEYFVVKNTMARIVLDKVGRREAVPMIDGGVGISFSGNDIIATCKALVTFSKEHDKFKVKYAFLEGKSVTAERLRELASLPSKNILIIRVLVGMKSPITGFVNVLGEVTRKFVYVVDAIRSSKEKAGAGVSHAQDKPVEDKPAA
jgi:large subunit ribosomal protein L10